MWTLIKQDTLYVKGLWVVWTLDLSWKIMSQVAREVISLIAILSLAPRRGLTAHCQGVSWYIREVSREVIGLSRTHRHRAHIIVHNITFGIPVNNIIIIAYLSINDRIESSLNKWRTFALLFNIFWYLLSSWSSDTFWSLLSCSNAQGSPQSGTCSTHCSTCSTQSS